MDPFKAVEKMYEDAQVKALELMTAELKRVCQETLKISPLSKITCVAGMGTITLTGYMGNQEIDLMLDSANGDDTEFTQEHCQPILDFFKKYMNVVWLGGAGDDIFMQDFTIKKGKFSQFIGKLQPKG